MANYLAVGNGLQATCRAKYPKENNIFQGPPQTSSSHFRLTFPGLASLAQAIHGPMASLASLGLEASWQDASFPLLRGSLARLERFQS